MLRYRKKAVLLVALAAILAIGMLPWAVFAEDDTIEEMISSATEPQQAVLPTSITGGAIGMTADAKSAILIDAASGTV